MKAAVASVLQGVLWLRLGARSLPQDFMNGYFLTKASPFSEIAIATLEGLIRFSKEPYLALLDSSRIGESVFVGARTMPMIFGRYAAPEQLNNAWMKA